jgi:anaerobic selenocysteine-containing dehydrogenase
MAWSFPKLTRRTFLKGSAAVGLSGIVGSQIANASLPSLSDLKFAHAKRGEMKEKNLFHHL